MYAPLPNSFFSTMISDQLPNGQVFTGMGWVDEEGSVSHQTTVSNIHSPEECMDECASNRKSNGQGCVAFTFVENIKRLAWLQLTVVEFKAKQATVSRDMITDKF